MFYLQNLWMKRQKLKVLAVSWHIQYKHLSTIFGSAVSVQQFYIFNLLNYKYIILDFNDSHCLACVLHIYSLQENSFGVVQISETFKFRMLKISDSHK